MAPIQIVGVLFDLQKSNVFRIVCRVELQDEPRDYHIYVDRRTARTIDQLLDERPFRALRLHPDEGTSLSYLGDLAQDLGVQPVQASSGDPWAHHQVLYLELSHRRSRRKYKLEVPTPVVQQFHWLATLSTHDVRLSRDVLEA